MSEGDYSVDFIYGNYSATKPIHMSGNSIKATISAPTQIGYVNQEMNFFSSTHNATNSEWNFGDGTIITGISNPSYAYPESGSFEVVLTCTNSFGCQLQDSVTSLFKFTVIVFENPVTVIGCCVTLLIPVAPIIFTVTESCC